MKTQLIAVVASLTFVSFAAAQQSAGTLVIPGCHVHPLSVVGEAQVPAEEAGKINSIEVREGMQVRRGALLATIDDTQPQKQKRVAEAEHNAAKRKAESNIDIDHAQAAADVAKYDLLRSEQSNSKVPGSVSPVEIEQKKFQWKRALLAIEQAKNEQIISGFTAEAKLAEMEAADDAIGRRRINSPIDGVVQHVYSSLGGWVKPGDPVIRILRMDKLRVEALVNHKDAGPAQLIDRPVLVEVMLAGGQKASFNGKVVFIDPEVDPAGQRVYAEVDNQQDSAGHWLLRPGMGLQPTMTIQLR